jgi:hypothetical protein
MSSWVVFITNAFLELLLDIESELPFSSISVDVFDFVQHAFLIVLNWTAHGKQGRHIVVWFNVHL